MNELFRSGKATNRLGEVGIIVHGFDAMEDPDDPWKPCPADALGCATLRDRLSCSIINAGMADADRRYGMPLFASPSGGLIMRGEANKLLCAYSGDGGTRGVVCHGEAQCVPGCVQPGGEWCDALRGAGDGWCDGRPFAPKHLSTVLNRFMLNPGAYNEMVFDASTWGRNLPHSVLAIFYPDNAGDDGQFIARDAHRRMLEEYKLTADELPLVVLRLNDWDRPFEVAPVATAYGDTYDDRW